VSHVIIGDVRNLAGERLLSMLDCRRGEIDVVFGGPPCQGFSRGGKRNFMDPRDSLVFEFLRLVLDVRPKAMAMENVPGIVDMTTAEGIPILDAAARILEDSSMAGYEAFKRMLSAGQIAGRLRTKSAQKTGTPTSLLA
jgi:DNA (cytosine-5)-methyltransferase 1